MTLEFAAIPLALLAGVAGVLSPCVWPLVPVLNRRTTLTLSSLSGRLRIGAALPPPASSAWARCWASCGCRASDRRWGPPLPWLPSVRTLAFVVMLAYGVGTAGVLLLAGLASGRLLQHWRGAAAGTARFGKLLVGWSLLLLGVLVMTGLDKTLEALAVSFVPGWVYSF